MRRKDATYIVKNAFMGYAETTKVFRQFFGGRELVAEFPRREKRAAKLLADVLNGLSQTEAFMLAKWAEDDAAACRKVVSDDGGPDWV